MTKRQIARAEPTHAHNMALFNVRAHTPANKLNISRKYFMDECERHTNDIREVNESTAQEKCATLSSISHKSCVCFSRLYTHTHTHRVTLAVYPSQNLVRCRVSTLTPSLLLFSFGLPFSPFLFIFIPSILMNRFVHFTDFIYFYVNLYELVRIRLR